MTPVVPGFHLQITEYAKNQPEYITLPCYREENGTVTTRWKLSWAERVSIFLGGSLWLQVLTFNGPLQPVKLTASCPIMGSAMLDREE